jgi:CDP-glucose 4,6-dehydratase
MLEIYKGKRVFITGHTGFKGTWLTCFLDVLGAQHAGFSLLPYTDPSHFSLLGSNKTSTIGDLANIKLLKTSINNFQPEIVFHLAAQPLVRESYKNPITTYQTNVMGTLNVLEAIRECNSVTVVVVITTDKVYENREWIYPYRENDPLGGYDMYSSSKACSEVLVKSYQRSFFNLARYKVEHNVLVATARAGNVIGGGDWSTDRLIPDIIRATVDNRITKIRNPDAVRPWQHVLDCLYGYLLLGERLLKEEIKFSDSWNFAPYSYDSKTVAEVAGIAKSIWERINIETQSSDKTLHEASILRLDNSKAFSELAWIPKWNTELAVEKSVIWYKEYYLNNKVITYSQIDDYLK